MTGVFALKGKIDGREATLRWEGGRLDGPAFAVVLVDTLPRRPMIAQTPTGPFYEPALTPGHVAYLTIRSVFDGEEVELVEGELPELPDDSVPEGAIP